MLRAKRLQEALPRVSEAVQDIKVFKEDCPKVWNDFRRGLNDLKKESNQLEQIELPEACIRDTWEFILALMDAYPKFSRQILDAVSILLCAPSWAEGWKLAKGKKRLALWKLSPSSGGTTSPVDVTLELLKCGAAVDDLLPANEVIENGTGFLEALFTRANATHSEVCKQLETSSLGQAWKQAQEARSCTKTEDPTPTHGSSSCSISTSFGDMEQANRAQVASFEEIVKQDKRPGCQKDVVDSLLDVSIEAFDCAAACLQPMLSGYAGEQNIAASAKAQTLEFRRRLSDLHAKLVVMGPCQSGKTSLVYALAGFATLPPATPSMVTTQWVHTPNLAVPRLSIPMVLAEVLETWEKQAHTTASGIKDETEQPIPDDTVPPTALPQTVEGTDAVAEALERINKIVYFGRRQGSIGKHDLEKLSRPSMSISIELAFTPLANLDERLADTGTLSLVDVPSPDSDSLWDRQDLANLLKRSLHEADGALVVVDASRHEVPRWFADLLRESFVQERLLRRDDAWIVANRIDQIPEFLFFQDGLADVRRRVKEQQHRNFHDVIATQNHVIPTAARLSVLAVYGLRQVTQQLEPQLLAELSRQPWFAQLCFFLHGVHWHKEVKMMELYKWRQSMRELQLLGQVTGDLATSVLEMAYVKMLPRSAGRVMFDLAKLISDFVASLQCLEGGATIIDSEMCKQMSGIFEKYFTDAQTKVIGALHQQGPVETAVFQFASSKCNAEFTIDGADAAELNEKYFTLLAREALGTWQPIFQEAVVSCCNEAARLHEKWQRSIDKLLMTGGVDAVTKQKVLLNSQKLDLLTTTDGRTPLQDAERDRLVQDYSDKVPVAVTKQLFSWTKKSFLITPDVVCSFLVELCDSWRQASEIQIFRRCLEPVQRNFNNMMHSIEEHNALQLKRPQKGTFDFTFARRLSEILPKVASFNAQEGETPDGQINDEQALLCEQLCDEVRSCLQEIRLAS